MIVLDFWNKNEAAKYVLEPFPHLSLPTCFEAAHVVHYDEDRDWASTILGAFLAVPRGERFPDGRLVTAELGIRLEGKRPIPYGIWASLFRYAFIGLGYTRLSCRVSINNTASIRLCEKLGFKQEGIEELGFDGVNDAILFGMTRKNCRWLNGLYPVSPGSRCDGDGAGAS